MTLKEQIHNHCRQIVADKLDLLRQKQQDLSESIAGETKSSAGDKYETSRAMLHIEQEQLARQIAGLSSQLALLNTINPAAKARRAALGSLLHIGDIYYYLSIGLGKMQVTGMAVIALSPQSPLGSKLKGLGEGDVVEMNGGNKLLVERFSCLSDSTVKILNYFVTNPSCHKNRNSIIYKAIRTTSIGKMKIVRKFAHRPIKLNYLEREQENSSLGKVESSSLCNMNVGCL